MQNKFWRQFCCLLAVKSLKFNYYFKTDIRVMQEVQEEKVVIVNSVESVKQPKSVKDLRSMFE